jgi:Ca2+-binding RTX toxin-like protein
MATTSIPVTKNVLPDLNANVKANDIPKSLVTNVKNDLLESDIVPTKTARQLETAILESGPRKGAGRIVGTPEDDFLAGTFDSDQIFGKAGNDIIISLGGDDQIFGDNGADLIVSGDGSDNIEAGSGDDQVFGDAGNDVINGGDGVDVINGGDGNDRIIGGNGGDRIFGDAGNDNINGNAGNDNINGGDGADIISGDGGNDRVFGGSGDDDIFGNAGNDSLNGDAGDDLVEGGTGNDTIFGGTGFGNDTLSGGDGIDLLIGGAGNDYLSGGNGNDRLIGTEAFGSGFGFDSGESDTLTGGAGSDTFVLGAGTQIFYRNGGQSDFALITDFNINQDLIELPLATKPSSNFTEIGDAGQSIFDAKVIPNGSQQLNSISGKLSDANDVDLYQITIADGATFSATTVNTGTTIDTQLFLFDSNGLGVFGNDQASFTSQSTLPTGLALQAGTYFLAISSFNNDPVSDGGLIFPDFPFDQVVGPTEVGGNLPLNGFTFGGGSFSNGDYKISLTGVQSTPLLSLGASPTGLPPGTAISFQDDIIAIVQGVSISDFSSGFAFV